MIEQVEKIRLIFPKKNLNDILKKIASLECMDFYELKKLPDRNSETLEQVKNNFELAKSLTSYIKPTVNFEKENISVFLFFNFAKEKLNELKNLSNQKEELIKKIQELKPLENLHLSSSEAKKLIWLNAFLLNGPIKEQLQFQQTFSTHLVFEEVGSSTDNKKTFLYLSPANKTNEILEKISQLKLQNIPLPEYSPKLELKKLKKNLKTVKGQIIQIQNQISQKSPSLKSWNKFLFELKWQSQVLSLQSKVPQTKSFTILEGWVIKKVLPKLIEELKKISKYIIIEKVPFAHEEAPVKLLNKKVKPFEVVTKLYGMPKPTELDPTPYLAPFFVIFFGFALSDAGYGLALFLIGTILLALKKKLPNLIHIAQLSIFLGLSTVIFGYAFGTFGGINLSKIIDPQLQPILILLICFAFGLLQIITGMIINLIHKAKHQTKFINLLNESGYWILVLISIFVLLVQNIFNMKVIQDEVLLKTVLFILLLNLISYTLFSPKKILGLFKGLGSLYNGVGFLADTLSYSRLFALGLATGVLAYTINLVAGILKNMINIPIISEIVFLTILVGGHLFNIAINVLGAFIHSSRLQFVEFFSKFLEGGGRQFEPLKYKD